MAFVYCTDFETAAIVNLYIQLFCINAKMVRLPFLICLCISYAPGFKITDQFCIYLHDYWKTFLCVTCATRVLSRYGVGEKLRSC